jgi:glycosyltransferase involved in cell wall biosynthesis
MLRVCFRTSSALGILSPDKTMALSKPRPTVSVVIPALNEEAGIAPVLHEVPVRQLNLMGYSVDLLVIDNGSTDLTPDIARRHGARVIVQPVRGYGNAYKAGFANARGDIIATGDADLTYPFSVLPEAVRLLDESGYDFITTDRLSHLDSATMTGSHVLGNHLLSSMTKLLFGWPYRDSQSGMWIFKRRIWEFLDVRSPGMAFSQELKIEAHAKGFKCHEMPIRYRTREGQVKLHTFRDGFGNVTQLLAKRITLAGRSGVTRPNLGRNWKVT